MMTSDFHFRDKIPVAILGATGAVGQRFVEILSHHPWFEIASLGASEKSVGKRYQDAVNWMMATPLPKSIASMTIEPCHPQKNIAIAFSALDSSVATQIELDFEKSGIFVVSNAKNHRMDPSVPLLIPEINPTHLDMIQEKGKRKIVTNPNCSAIGICLALKPLHDLFEIECLNVVTMQAISGAGYPGVPSMDIVDNLIPFIDGEEDKLETEPLKIFGSLLGDRIVPAVFKISAQCNRVPVCDGHTACVSVTFKKKAKEDDIIAAWQSFKGVPQEMALPMAPLQPIRYFNEEKYPQPKIHRQLDKGMSVSTGRLRACPLFDHKFIVLSHNTIRGAAGGAVLCGELAVKKGLIYW